MELLKCLLIISGMASCTIAWAATWYVRPAGPAYGNGDGSSYANAWRGFSRVKLFARNGDTIVVCGTHRETLIIKKSGLTIDLDCSNDPAIILGSDSYGSAAWDGPDVRDEYTRLFSIKPHVVAYDDDILLKGVVGSLKTGQWGVAGSGPYTVHIKKNPKGHRLEVGQRPFGIQLGETDRDVIHGITVIGGGKAWIKYVGSGNQYQYYGRGISAFYDSWPHENWGGTWKIDGVNFYGIEEQAIHTNGYNTGLASTPDFITVRHCRILENGAEGIYIKGVFGGVLVENNIIGDKDHDKFGWDGVGFGDSYDGDGIDLGGGPTNAANNVVVRKNTITNIRGVGIFAVAGNIILESNVIENPNSWAEPADKACITIDPVYPEPTHVQGNKCIADHADGIQVRGAALSRAQMILSENLVVLGGRFNNYAAIRHNSLNGYNASYLNNTLIGGKYGIFWSKDTENPTNAKVINNIFYRQDYPLYMLPTVAAGIVVIGNLFWPADVQGKPFKVGGQDYKSIEDVQAIQRTFSRNLLGDPSFKDVTQADFHLKANSPAIGNGTRWWSTTPPVDFSGVPFSDASVDIGSFQSSYDRPGTNPP